MVIMKSYTELGMGELGYGAMMYSKQTRYHKPNLMFLLSLFVGLGVLVTSLVQAAEPIVQYPAVQEENHQNILKDWFHSLSDLKLTEKLQNWKPKLDTSGDGVNLAYPFGDSGPSLRVSNALPDAAQRSLRAGGDHRIGAVDGDGPDAYLFFQKRW